MQQHYISLAVLTQCINMSANLSQHDALLQQQQQHLMMENTQTQVEAALADLVSGVETQVIQTDDADHQISLIDNGTTSSVDTVAPGTSSSSSHLHSGNAPWAWHFVFAGAAVSAEGDSAASSPTTTSSTNNLVGFVHTVEDAYDVMRSYEVHTTSKFVQVRTVQDFGKDLDSLKYQHRVRFEDRKKGKDSVCTTENRLPFKDTPFLLLGTKWFECQHGRDYHVNFKRKRKEAIETGDIVVKRRNKATKTKKVGCLAKVWMKDVLVFPKKKLRSDVKTARKMLSKEIRAGAVKGERRIYVFLPDPSDHKNHAVGEASGFTQRVDPQVIDNIYWLVRQGIHSTADVQTHIERYVKEELFRYQTPPSTSNRRFFPTKKDIRNHIMAARRGRLPPKDRAEIAKQSSSLTATMCVSNKLAFPKTNQTTRCRALAKKILVLSKKITNPSIMSEATRKMEDLVAFLRAGAQKEERVQRMQKRAKEPSVLQSTTLERPPLRKRKKVDKESSGNSEETGPVSERSTEVTIQQKVVEQSKEPNQEPVTVTPTEHITHLSTVNPQDQRQQIDLVTSQPSQQIMFQTQAQGPVEISLPTLPDPQQIPFVLGNHGNNQGSHSNNVILQRILQGTGTQGNNQGGQSNNGASAIFQRFLQGGGSNQQVSVLPQESLYQAAVNGWPMRPSGEVMVQVADPQLNRVTVANDVGNSSPARTLIQLEGFPIQLQTTPSVIPNSSVVYTSSSIVQGPPPPTSSSSSS